MAAEPMANEVILIENEPELEESDNSKDRSLLIRLFGPLEAGSLRGSILNMIILTLGSGCLSLPKYVGNTSLVFSVFLIIAVGLLVWWCLNLLSIACDSTNNYFYSRLVKEKYGKGMFLFFNVIVILSVFGVLILTQAISKLCCNYYEFSFHSHRGDPL